MAQRLVRVICKKCKTVDDNPNMEHLQALRINKEDLKKTPVYKGAGCSQCQNTGYKGRIAIFEMFEMNNEIRELAFTKAPTTELRKAAKAGGMKTLMVDGIRKVFKGTTTPEEVVRITQTEGSKID
jgi:type II secretory ATPase GspE/PulE/Tfp pilus assembly ATPase PilB-like protein